jgi:glycosyltransferase involved in cell wall biosynthesis
MRILLITDNWLPQISGFTRTFTAVIEELEQEGDTFEVIHPGYFRSLPCPTYPEIRLALTTKRRIAGLVERVAPDAIHIAIEGPLGLAARGYCLEQGVAFTTSYTTKWPEYLRARFPLPRRISYSYLAWFHAPAARCMVASPSLRNELSEKGFRNLASWGRGVDTDLFQPRGKDSVRCKRPLWMYVGRVAVEKNIRAFLDLNLEGTKCVVGAGPQLQRLRAEYPDVRFVGARQGLDLARLYSSADVVVFPSKTDTFGLVMLEALACGVPVAAYPVTGPIDVIGDADVGVVEENLEEAARKALSKSPEACRRFAEEFAWSESAAQFRRALAPIG